ncbi:hypothetical protein [Streptomyces sp. NPDC059003]|uniref:hypothetical protein n=1 Tax=Streptomyces sp. NPDC059003 TaxID=3346691 RepID=UPI00369E2CD0
MADPTTPQTATEPTPTPAPAPEALSGPAPHLTPDTPALIPVIIDPDDYATLQTHHSFPHTTDHPAYLTHTETLLRTHTTHGQHTLALHFDATHYTDFCTSHSIDPDTPTSRARYTLELAAHGPHLTYQGQDIDTLIHQLIDRAAQHACGELAHLLLDDAGSCKDCGQDRANAAIDRAGRLLDAVLDRAGTGSHTLTCTCTADGERLTIGLTAEQETPDTPTRFDDTDAARLVAVLAAALAASNAPCTRCTTPDPEPAPRSTGALLLRTTAPHARDRLTGWRLLQGHLHPLTAAEVFDAHCTNPFTGDVIPPLPHTDFLPGYDLTPGSTWPTP